MIIWGMEVPFLSNDSINWIEASVPRSGDFNTASNSKPTEDYASYSDIDSTSTYLIWRIHKSQPNAIEMLEVVADGEIPSVGLRVVFPEALFRFAYICKNKAPPTHDNAYLLYALTIFGTAYLIQLKNISAYDSSYVFQPRDEFLHFDTRISPDCPPITAAAASNTGCLVVGRNDGSLRYFLLGNWYDDDPVVIRELRDATVSCFGDLLSSNSSNKSVKELVITKDDGRLIFVLHSNACVGVWDLSYCVKLSSISLTTGAADVSWLSVVIGNANYNTIQLVVLGTYIWSLEPKHVIIYRALYFPFGGGIGRLFCRLLAPEFENHSFHLSKAKVIDMRISFHKIWVLQEDGLLSINWCSKARGVRHCYSLQEAFISKQLFQDSKHSLDAFYQTTCSMFPSKDQMIGFISSIFLRRLMQPGVHSSSVFRLLLEDYNKHWTDHEFRDLTIYALRREILSVIQHEAISGSPLSAFKCWKNFCLRYFTRWCKSSAPIRLLVDPHSGGVGLIRKNNVSLFRSLGDSELLMYGTNFEELQKSTIYTYDALSNDYLEHEILLNVRGCIRTLNRQLGPAISPGILYELVGDALLESADDGIPYLLRTMKCGYNTSISDAALHVSELLGANFVWQKGLADYRFGLGEFSFSMFQSVEALHKKAKGWNKILNVLKRYLGFLVPQKLKPSNQNLDSDTTIFNTKIPIIVQATSQVAGLMFESALCIFLFLSYILDVSSQVDMLPDDVLRIQSELIPMVNDIIGEWLIIHLCSTMPSDSLSADYLGSQLSSLTIDENSKQRSWTKKLGSVDFTIAFVVLLDAHKGNNYLSLKSLPNPGSLTTAVRYFIGWMCSRSGEKPLYGVEHTTELTVSLLRYGQYNAIEILLMIVDAHSRCEKLFGNFVHGERNMLHHLLECCLLARSKVEHVDLHKILESMKPDVSFTPSMLSENDETSSGAFS